MNPNTDRDERATVLIDGEWRLVIPCPDGRAGCEVLHTAPLTDDGVTPRPPTVNTGRRAVENRFEAAAHDIVYGHEFMNVPTVVEILKRYFAAAPADNDEENNNA